MKQRDDWKAVAKQLAVDNKNDSASDEEMLAWNKYKKFRNIVNNKKKTDEMKYKSEKINENLDSPEKTWRTAKQFMNWKQQGPPNQLQVGSLLVTKACLIAKTMNEYFIEKVSLIRAGISSLAANLSICSRVM